ncbi:UDP-glucose/GDP-mannose dehydrogenase family protein [Candidatus Oleimmundimicrobium sp.]|uniref:UDP-glucose dehydrogenase family protein n=1 Tax=Candidatus Oleimmundimicrobium sp. TaxID=3060597 RepID=UPI00271F2300|nr:UDP-glucose/GDP-mannose dehydrogenase family protein [Candidatus Oleimmundimicrobium sp.]MDO8886353.1 UDP-glucose/GDP-mannose dehydrogenase family protein [Candidatus Oleimmundimicrobium sp.]
MKLCFIGSGYVGLVSAACFADLGHEVFCVDKDNVKIESLKKGIVPFYEPGLGELVKKNVEQGHLKFTKDLKEALTSSNIVFITVGTPSSYDRRADLSQVRNAAFEIGKNISDYKVIVNKSTVPVGTADLVEKIIKENQTKKVPFDVISNPEFLREGNAIYDFMNPDRVVIGTSSEKAKVIMEKLYSSFSKVMFTDVRSAEMIKYASNAFLATKVSFINEVANLCEKVGADVTEVAKGMGHDKRIGADFLNAGIGFSGSCFPKDTKALAEIAKENGCESEIVSAAIKVNDKQKLIPILKLKDILGDIRGKTIGILGLSFIPDTDDIRDAASIDIIRALLAEGADVKATDPVATFNMKKMFPKLMYFEDVYETVKNCDALILVTEWNEYKGIDFAKVKNLMRKPIIIDGRNLFNREELEKLGFYYEGIGR